MAVKFFGQFLLERGAVAAEDLLSAIEYQRKRNLKFGDFAVANGYVSKEDVERIHQYQQTHDVYFGEAAIALGILGQETVEEILQRQKNDHVFLGEALVMLGHLDHKRLGDLLVEFRTDQARYATGQIEVPVEAGELRSVAPVAVDLTQKMLLRVADIRAKCEPLAFGSAPAPGTESVVTRVALWGKPPLALWLVTGRVAARKIAIAFFGEEDADDDALVADACREFINIIAGNVVARLVQRGTALELQPPETMPAPPDGDALVARYNTDVGPVQLLLTAE